MTRKGCSSFGNCTSLRLPGISFPGEGLWLQFLRELHFIEAAASLPTVFSQGGCSSFGNCTSLRLGLWSRLQ